MLWIARPDRAEGAGDGRGLLYNGKALDCLDKVRGIEAIPSIRDVVVVPYTRTSVDTAACRRPDVG